MFVYSAAMSVSQTLSLGKVHNSIEDRSFRITVGSRLRLLCDIIEFIHQKRKKRKALVVMYENSIYEFVERDAEGAMLNALDDELLYKGVFQ